MDPLFEMARNAGCEGIVSKRLGSVYRGHTTHLLSFDPSRLLRSFSDVAEL
jgi:ATP-dependent DNA ligase